MSRSSKWRAFAIESRYAADRITALRMVFSVALFALKPPSPLFGALYLLCGVSDALDGFVARKLHIESEAGARLDSAADLLFAAVYAAKVLPLMKIPPWIWVWTAVIAAVKAAVIIVKSKRIGRFTIDHSHGNRLTGVLIFLLPLTLCFSGETYGAAFACAAASGVLLEEIIRLLRVKR